MKISKITLFLLVLSSTLLHFESEAQTYNVSTLQKEYKTLENALILTDNGYQLDTAYNLLLPFDFEVLNQNSNSIWVTSKGNIAFGPSYDSLNHFGINAFRIELQSDFSDPSISPILYEITGDEGERIVKIEWKTAYFRALEGFFDFINMQVWMYEKDHSIELRYGKSSLELITTRYQDEDSLGHFGGIVGVAYNTDTNYVGTNLTGDSTMPTITNLIVNDPNTIPEFRLGFPNDSTVFRLTKISTSNSHIQKEKINTSYHSEAKSINIELQVLNPNTKYQLVSSNGQLVNHGNITSGSETIDVSMLTSGIYILSINSNSNISYSKKFSIQNHR